MFDTVKIAGEASEDSADERPLRLIYSDPFENSDSTDEEVMPRSVSVGELKRDQATIDARNLLGSGWLRRGQGGIINAATGIGKSSFIMQAACCWAVGIPFFGIRPHGPLRSLICQYENDEIDCCEMRDGIFKGCVFTETEMELIARSVQILTCYASGESFVSEIAPDVKEWKPDLIFCDPLFACAGGVSQEDLTPFLRSYINPFLERHGCGIIFTHHTNKPRAPKDSADYSGSGTAYFGSGHNEQANWSRFNSALIAAKGSRKIFRWELGKRYRRAGVCDANGEPVTHILVAHSEDPERIHWRSADAAEYEQEEAANVAVASNLAEIFTTFNRNHRDGRIPTEELAKKLGISTRTLSRRFSANGGRLEGPEERLVWAKGIGEIHSEKTDE